MRDVDRQHFEQKTVIAQNLVQIEKRFRHAYANETHKFSEVSVLSTCVYRVIARLYLRLSQTNAEACVAFLQRQNDEQTELASRRRNDEFAQVVNHRERIESVSQLIDENQSANSILFR